MIKGTDGNYALVWVCAYANRQWNLGDDVSSDPSQSSFHRAMRLSHGTIAIVDRDAGYFSRVWCCYEVTTAAHASPHPPMHLCSAPLAMPHHT